MMIVVVCLVKMKAQNVTCVHFLERELRSTNEPGFWRDQSVLPTDVYRHRLDT